MLKMLKMLKMRKKHSSFLILQLCVPPLSEMPPPEYCVCSYWSAHTRLTQQQDSSCAQSILEHQTSHAAFLWQMCDIWGHSEDLQLLFLSLAAAEFLGG